MSSQKSNNQSSLKHKLGVAIIGCGKMGLQHAKVIQESKKAELIAVADPSANVETLGEIIGKEVKIYTTTRELFEEIRPDVVHVVTPPDTHYEVGKIALENGAHVLIEKPFVLKKAHAEELVRVAQSRGLKLFAGHQLLAHNSTIQAEKYVKYIGDVIHLESYFAFRKVRKSISAVTQAIDILPHPVYTLLHFLKAGNDTENGFVVKSLDAEADGEIRAVLKLGRRKGILVITLKGRPVDSYLKIVGTNGSVYIDYVRGVVVNLTGTGADAISAILNPYRQGWQTACKTTKALAGLAIKKTRSYEGLAELIENFYLSIFEEKELLISPESIIEAVTICESIGTELKAKERKEEERARLILDEKTKALPRKEAGEYILVTGGNGFLGRAICRQLRSAGWPVKSISRREPRFSDRDPGVEYVAMDLSDGILTDALRGASAIIHCAAETAGGKEDHQRNSIDATRKILEAAAAAGIKKFIYISSLAVLKPGQKSGRPLDENSPVDLDNIGRGPYVWGKAKAEEIAVNMGKRLGVELKIIRPGPLVDFENFEAPGRLGREVGSYFVVMGSRKSPLSVCDVRTVAKVVEKYINCYDSSPRLLNLIEPGAYSRKGLVLKHFEKRKDLKALYIPTASIRIISYVLKVVQKIISPSRKTFDVAAAFASERYNTSLAKEIISKASCY
jgi:predicted dehydrogenase/nucleoside-diphosphate-sugar epimerase